MTTNTNEQNTIHPREEDALRTGDIPAGYEDSVEAGPGGWPVWSRPEGLTPLCPGPDCVAVYMDDPEDRVHALECPACGAVGCEECIMIFGRGCLCVDCEESA